MDDPRPAMNALVEVSTVIGHLEGMSQGLLTMNVPDSGPLRAAMDEDAERLKRARAVLFKEITGEEMGG